MSYEDQLSAAKFRADRDALAQAVQGVCEDMEEHALGFEGMEDAPVTRWDRDLRAALGGMQEAVEHAMTMDPNAQRLLQEDEDAARWVREHGGLELIITHEETFKQLMRERDRYRDLYRRSCAASGDLAEWKREVYELCEYIGVNHEDCDGEKEMLEKAYNLLDKRLMPEGYEWPRYESGEPVILGDPFKDDDGNWGPAYYITFDSVNPVIIGINTIAGDYEFSVNDGERLKRPQVLAADGEPLEVGQTVWHVTTGREYTVGKTTNVGAHLLKYGKPGGYCRACYLTHQRPVLDADGKRIETGMDVWWVCEGDERGVHAERLHVESIGEDGFVTCSPFNGGTWVELEPSELYVHKPVLDADGVPINEGDTVYLLPGEWCDKIPCCGFHGGEELTAHPDYNRGNNGGICCINRWHGSCYPQASQLTHTKPVPQDSWGRLEKDAAMQPYAYCVGHGLYGWDDEGGTTPTNELFARDLVRRCKALAGVSE